MLTETWAMAHLVGALFALAPANDVRPLQAEPNPLTAPNCPGIELVIATEASDPEESLATLVTQADARAHLRSPGDEIAGKRLVFVGYNGARMSPAAWLASPTELCQALLFEKPAGDGGAPAAPREAARTEPVAAPRSSRLRVVPVLRSGSVVGIRLLGLAPGGLLGALGLENGDTLESVNGFELGTPGQALRAYTALRQAERLSLRLVRRGRPMTIDFVIR